jgi:hypothetical protein
MVVDGIWYAVHHRELETWKWTDAGMVEAPKPKKK